MRRSYLGRMSCFSISVALQLQESVTSRLSCLAYDNIKDDVDPCYCIIKQAFLSSLYENIEHKEVFGNMGQEWALRAVVKTTCCSGRGPGFGFQHPHLAAHSYL